MGHDTESRQEGLVGRRVLLRAVGRLGAGLAGLAAWSAIAGCAPAPASGPASAPAAKARELFVGVYGGWEQAAQEIWVPPLREKLPGANVFFETGLSADLLAKLRAEKSNPKHHLVTMDANVVPLAKKEDLIARLDRSRIPNLTDIYPEFIAAEEHGVAIGSTSIGIAYHDSVPAPTSWADLWKPEYKGKIGVPGIRLTQGLILLVMAGSVKSGKPPSEAQRDADACFAGMRDLKPNIHSVFSSQTSAIASMASNREPPVIACGTNKFVIPEQKKGAPIHFVTPKEGAFALLNSVVVVKDSSDVDAAMELVNIALSPAAQSALCKALFLGPSNRKATLPEDMAKDVPYGPESVKQLIHLDWDWINAQRDAWTERWNKEIAG